MPRIGRLRWPGPDYRDAVLATNPVGYWRLGEAAGTVARDEMGRNDGTYVGSPTLGVAGLLAGDGDRAVTLNGTTQYVSTTVPTTFGAGTSPFTIALWLNHTPEATAQRIFCSRDAANHNGILLYGHSAGLGFGRYDAAASDVASNTALTAGPHFLVGAYDGATLRTYVDAFMNTVGVANPLASTRTIAPATTLYVGGSVAGGSFNGTVDEPAIWNRALTSAEIAGLYRVGMGR